MLIKPAHNTTNIPPTKQDRQTDNRQTDRDKVTKRTR